LSGKPPFLQVERWVTLRVVLIRRGISRLLSPIVSRAERANRSFMEFCIANNSAKIWSEAKNQ
jgi:hypothetical protein